MHCHLKRVSIVKAALTIVPSKLKREYFHLVRFYDPVTHCHTFAECDIMKRDNGGFGLHRYYLLLCRLFDNRYPVRLIFFVTLRDACKQCISGLEA